MAAEYCPEYGLCGSLDRCEVGETEKYGSAVCMFDAEGRELAETD